MGHMFPAGKRPRQRLNRNGIFAPASSTGGQAIPHTPQKRRSNSAAPFTVFASPAVNPGPVFWPFRFSRL